MNTKYSLSNVLQVLLNEPTVDTISTLKRILTFNFRIKKKKRFRWNNQNLKFPIQSKVMIKGALVLHLNDNVQGLNLMRCVARNSFEMCSQFVIRATHVASYY